VTTVVPIGKQVLGDCVGTIAAMLQLSVAVGAVQVAMAHVS
jgi:hypothetical protein